MLCIEHIKSKSKLVSLLQWALLHLEAAAAFYWELHQQVVLMEVSLEAKWGENLFLFLYFSPCLSLVRVNRVNAGEVIVTLLTIYTLCEHVRKGWRECFFSVCACSHVFFACLLWLFPYPICPSLDNKGFSSLSLQSHHWQIWPWFLSVFLHEWKCEILDSCLEITEVFVTCLSHNTWYDCLMAQKIIWR